MTRDPRTPSLSSDVAHLTRRGLLWARRGCGVLLVRAIVTVSGGDR